MGKRERDKGKRGEREWAAALGALGFPARRGQQFSGIGGADVVGGIPGTHAEVKRTERLRIHEAVAQAVADAEGGEIPYVASRRNRDDWLVTIRAQDLPHFAELVYSALEVLDAQGLRARQATMSGDG